MTDSIYPCSMDDKKRHAPSFLFLLVTEIPDFNASSMSYSVASALGLQFVTGPCRRQYALIG